MLQGKTIDTYESTPASKPVPGGPGSQWRMMKLRRVYETAEEESRNVDDVALLVTLASSRLRERSVATLRSVHLARTSYSLEEFGHCSTADFWYDCHVDALCLLVPDMRLANFDRFEDC